MRKNYLLFITYYFLELSALRQKTYDLRAMFFIARNFIF